MKAPKGKYLTVVSEKHSKCIWNVNTNKNAGVNMSHYEIELLSV